MNTHHASRSSADGPTRPWHAGIGWFLAVGLGLFGLVRPLARIVTGQAEVETGAALPIGATVLVTVVWVAVVGLGRTRRPFATLVVTGLVYAVASILLSGILSPLLDGRLDGPLANPIAIVPVLAVNAGWGAVAGLLALAVRSTRDDAEVRR
ncbi:hypothetical protein ACPYO6_06690 [Georgenia sp. Z1344]|uniref:hypothetical protein n=1 Tax=Georgenia sp. Z1344 TaxID=3416706 RepID=UPI003CF7A108